MGLFDFFKRDSEVVPLGEDGQPLDRKMVKLRKTVADKRAQTYDRNEAMDQLVAMGSPNAVGALLRRFDLKVDPSITDQEEKQRAFDCIVRIGHGDVGIRLADAGKATKEIDDTPLSAEEKAQLGTAVVKATETYCQRAESLSWPLKVLRDLLDDEAFQSSLLTLLSKFDTEYSRNVEPKINLLTTLESFENDTVREHVEPYLDDVNETVRFHAVETVFRQRNEASLVLFLEMAEREESVRVKNKIAAGLVEHKWTVPAAFHDRWSKTLAGTKYLLKSGASTLSPR